MREESMPTETNPYSMREESMPTETNPYSMREESMPTETNRERETNKRYEDKRCLLLPVMSEGAFQARYAQALEKKIEEVGYETTVKEGIVASEDLGNLTPEEIEEILLTLMAHGPSGGPSAYAVSIPSGYLVIAGLRSVLVLQEQIENSL